MTTPGTLDKMDFYILLAVSKNPLHGYGISEQIRADSRSSILIAPTNLYRYLYRLEDAGLITPLEDAADPTSRKKVYQLTTAGRRHLKSEANHLSDAARLATLRIP